jgi:hypothetical protein
VALLVYVMLISAAIGLAGALNTEAMLEDLPLDGSPLRAVIARRWLYFFATKNTLTITCATTRRRRLAACAGWNEAACPRF